MSAPYCQNLFYSVLSILFFLLLFQSHVKTIKYGIISFVYQGAKQWNSLLTDAKDIECFNLSKNYLNTWMGSDCNCGYCVLSAIRTMLIDIRFLDC